MLKDEELKDTQGTDELEGKEDLEDDKLDKDNADKDSGSDTLDSAKDDEGLEGQRIPYNRFKDKVDEVNRLKKELKALEDEKAEEQNRVLQEQGKYKELYEDLQEEFAQFKQEKTNLKINRLLKDAGYKDEQVERLSKLVEGETEEEILESIEDLKITFPTKTYVDPSPDQRKRSKPEGVDGEEIGQSMFERLKNSGKLRGFK